VNVFYYKFDVPYDKGYICPKQSQGFFLIQEFQIIEIHVGTVNMDNQNVHY
jgi:hypothetical protein